MSLSVRLLLLLSLICPAVAFSRPLPTSPLAQAAKRSQHLSAAQSNLFRFRGGDQETEATKDTSERSDLMSAIALPSIASLGKAYAQSLKTSPIATKSVTAGAIFFLSDYAAQRIEKKADTKHDWKRTISTALVGLLYFGPAAHFWYDMIFRILPGTSLISTMQKAFLGQMFFGPSFTCIFFAVALVNSGEFSIGKWFKKVKTDLPGAWLAGCGFWPFVDLVSYSMIAPQFIPLFVNACSFFWTIYLSIVSNRTATKSD